MAQAAPGAPVVIDMEDVPAVHMQAQLFGTAQREFNHAKEALDRALYHAFRKVWPGSAGDRILVDFGSGSYGRPATRIEGRAVILRNGTKLGLYVDIGGTRHAVPEPYTANAKILKSSRAPVRG